MRVQEILNKSAEELKALKIDLKKELMNLRFMRTNQSEVAQHRFKEIRRTVARIETVIRQRQILGEKNA